MGVRAQDLRVRTWGIGLRTGTFKVCRPGLQNLPPDAVHGGQPRGKGLLFKCFRIAI